jgi:hypothetical protein
MGEVALFPGTEVIEIPEPEPALEPLNPAISDLLIRVIDFTSELKRRADLPLHLGFEAAELARLSDEILN